MLDRENKQYNTVSDTKKPNNPRGTRLSLFLNKEINREKTRESVSNTPTVGIGGVT